MPSVPPDLKRSLRWRLKHCAPSSTGPDVLVNPNPLTQPAAQALGHPSPTPHAANPTFDRAQQDVLVLLVGLSLLALWEWSRLDLPLIRLFATSSGFEWRDHWLTAKVMHQGARWVGWAFFGFLLASVWRPGLLVAVVPRRERICWIGTTLFCVALIPLLKRASATSCPWSLAQFGGEVVRYVPHWVLGIQDGGPGGCFPSGHASTAFALLPGWFAIRDYAPRAARMFLILVLVCGSVLAWVQMMRGAHYLSHSLWTAFICWTVSVISWHSLQTWRDRRSSDAASAESRA